MSVLAASALMSSVITWALPLLIVTVAIVFVFTALARRRERR